MIRPETTTTPESKPGDDHSLKMTSVVEALARARNIAELERMRRAMEAAGFAAYQWTVSDDYLRWSANAAPVLSVDGQPPSAGRAYAALLDPDAAAARFEAVMRSGNDDGSGVPFSVAYPLRPQGRAGSTLVVVEESGRWFAGADGRPAEVFGVVRRIGAQTERRTTDTMPRDQLTGLMMRARLVEALNEAVTEAQQSGSPCAFVIASVSNLAAINDAYGFDAADRVLATTARRLRQVTRAGDSVGRVTGAAFGMVLRQCGREPLTVAMERFLAATRDTVETVQGPVWPEVSFGAVLAPEQVQTAEGAITAADEALMRALRSANPMAIHEPAAAELSLRAINARCAREITEGLRANRFRLAFQTVIARDGSVALHEARVRLACGDDELVPVAHLLPVAERLGLVRLIDRQALMLTLDALEQYPAVALTLDLSAVTVADPRWQANLLSVISERANLAGRLMLGMPARVLDDPRSSEFPTLLRELGCQVAMHGPALASFANVDLVRIDIHTDDLPSIASELRAAGLKIMAGPACTLDEAEAMRANGADLMWGPLFGDAGEAPPSIVRPMPSDWRSESDQPAAGPDMSPLQRARAALDRGRAELERLRR